MFLTSDPIRPDTLAAEVSSPARGAVVSFVGLVRDHHGGRAVTWLDYEAYGPMAERECERIVAETTARWEVAVALRHRLGQLGVGDVAVAIAVGAAHRGPAFEACRYVIEELKRRVPIWKRESYADGSEAWVDPTAPDGHVPAGGSP
jgi:molybdopterin synthase catalytic subunit